MTNKRFSSSRPSRTHLAPKAVTDLAPYAGASVAKWEGSGTKGMKHHPFGNQAALDSFRSWVYVAANINANAVAALPLRLFTRHQQSKGGLFGTRQLSGWERSRLKQTACSHQVRRKLVEWGDDWEEVTEAHPILDLLSAVNPRQNGFDATALRVLWTELTGNAYMLKYHGRGEGKPPTELWPMPPQYTWAVPSHDEAVIAGYVYGLDPSERAGFGPDEVIHFRYPNPGGKGSGQFYGMGKVEAAWLTVMLNNANHEMDVALSENHARPDYAILMEGGTEDQAKRMSADLNRKHRGVKQAGKGLVLGSSGKLSMVPMQFAPKDLAGREGVITEVGGVFGVPESMLRLNDANLASSKTGHGQWREQTVLPIARRDEQTLNQDLVWPHWGDEYCLAYDNPVPSDRSLDEAEHNAQVTSGRMTINEARAMDGLGPERGGDVLRVNGVSLEALDAQALQPATAFSFGPSTPPDSPGDEPAEQDTAPTQPAAAAEDVNPAVTDAVKLNGAQITAAVVLLDGVAARTTPPGAARTLLVGLGLMPKDADAMILEALSFVAATPEEGTSDGTGPTPTPETNTYTAPAGPGHEGSLERSGQPRPAGAIGAGQATVSQADLCNGKGSCGCQGSPETLAQQWKRMTKGDAEQTVRDDEPQGPLEAFADTMAAIFVEQQEMIVRGLQSIKSITLPLGSVTKEASDADIARLMAQLKDTYADEIEAAAEGLIEPVITEGWAAGLAEVDQFGLDVVNPFDVTNPDVADFLQANTVQLTQQIENYTERQLTDFIAQGLDQGLTTDQMARGLQDDVSNAGGVLSPARARTIARTESARAFSRGKLQSWKDVDQIERKKWRLAANACQYCKAIAKIVNAGGGTLLDDPFLPKGTVLTGTQGGSLSLDYEDILTDPLHPNCRCEVMLVPPAGLELSATPGSHKSGNVPTPDPEAKAMSGAHLTVAGDYVEVEK